MFEMKVGIFTAAYMHYFRTQIAG